MRLQCLLCLTLLPTGFLLSSRGQSAPHGDAQSARSQEAAELQQLLDRHEYIEYDDKLLATDSAHLTGPQNLYFSGMLLFHLGMLENAAQRLSQVLSSDQEQSLSPAQIDEALEALGQIDLRLTFYGAAAKVESMLYQRLGSVTARDRQVVSDRRHLVELLVNVPPLTIDLRDDFILPAADAPLLTGPEYPVSIPGPAMPAKPLLARFDSGAEVSILSASTAKAWSVTMLEGTATLLGAGGSTYQAQPGFLPVLTIGKAQLHNVAVYVTADKNLYFSPLKVQLSATLGFPVMRALGRLTFEQDGSLHVEAKSPERDPHSTTLWMAAHFLLIELATRPVFRNKTLVDLTDDRLFVLDTGSASTILTDHYLTEHMDTFKGQQPGTGTLGGIDGGHNVSVYQTLDVPLFANSSGVMMLNGQPVLIQPMLGPEENYFGIIGQDVLSKAPGYTIDLRRMTFAILRNAAPK